MKNLSHFCLFLVVIVSFVSCKNSKSPTIDPEIAKKEVLQLHNAERKAHLEKKAQDLVANFSSNFISVSRGAMATPDRASSLQRFQKYFSSVEFEKWDDVKPPVVRFSADYSLAYTVVNKEVVITYQNPKNEKIREKTVYCWVSVYKKYPEGWQMDCIASTNQPSVITKLH